MRERGADKPAAARTGLSARQEARLIRQAQRGSATAADALVKAHWREIHRAAYLILGDSHEAEDVAQEAFVAAIEGLTGFRQGRRFGPWLRKIVVNRSIDAARARERRPVAVEVGASQAFNEDPVNLSRSELVEAVRRLPLDQRAVVVMRHALGYRTDEIAGALGVPRGTVGSRLRRGLDQLSKTYRRKDG